VSKHTAVFAGRVVLVDFLSSWMDNILDAVSAWCNAWSVSPRVSQRGQRGCAVYEFRNMLPRRRRTKRPCFHPPPLGTYPTAPVCHGALRKRVASQIARSSEPKTNSSIWPANGMLPSSLWRRKWGRECTTGQTIGLIAAWCVCAPFPGTRASARACPRAFATR